MGMSLAGNYVPDIPSFSYTCGPQAVQRCGNLLPPVPTNMRWSIGNDEFPVFRWSGGAEGATVARAMVSAASIIGRSGAWNA
jgi:hypothetical protein